MDGQLRISGWAPGMISDEVAVEVSGEAMAVSIPLAHIPGVLSVIGRSEEGELLEGVVWRALDTEHQGIPAGEEVELLPGAYDLVVVAPGHSPYTTRLTVTADTDDLLEVLLRPSKAEDAVDIIAITEAVHFQTAKAIILPESYALLDDVAAVLQATPEIRLVQVEGHTDDEGSPQGNQVLSEDRAAAIVAYLVHKGIAPERLSSVGYGQSRPVADNTTEQGRAQNRRVVFVVAERSTGGIGIGG